MPLLKQNSGFTLIEMLVVLAIIAILSLIALPSPEPAIVRKQVIESLELIENYKLILLAGYKLTAEFPKDNVAAGMPKAELILGNYVDKIEMKNGAFQIHFGNKAHPAIKDKTLSYRPIVVKESPQSPMSWLCGYAAVPNGMQAVGDDKTDVEFKYLPSVCRM